ncbi:MULTISPECIES: sigma-70 family RNA polymerase sigma factor [unclassified Sinorhizobium]|uniref:sigma-70 family RNA polymerase sigma factor n=1 Tax=unclassified Sinorhizobium TaxID=2613772 RepID=UPI0035264441
MTTPPDAAKDRPAAFDDLLVKALPKVRKYARRMTANADEAEAVISDMIEAVLRNWRSYREDGNFEKWCKFTIRSKAQSRRLSPSRRYEHVDISDVDIPSPATQETSAIASSTLRTIAGIGEGSEELMLFAIGHSQNSIGRMAGLTGERICQRIKAARAQLMAVA